MIPLVVLTLWSVAAVSADNGRGWLRGNSSRRHGQKADVCHYAATKNAWRDLSVSVSAISAHERHGDLVYTTCANAEIPLELCADTCDVEDLCLIPECHFEPIHAATGHGEQKSKLWYELTCNPDDLERKPCHKPPVTHGAVEAICVDGTCQLRCLDPNDTCVLPPEAPLGATVSVENTEFATSEPIAVTLNLERNSQNIFDTVKILTWFLPEHDLLTKPVFTVKHQGEAIPYTGVMATRPPPTDDDYLVVHSGDHPSYTYDITKSYDFSKPGRYEVSYNVFFLWLFSLDPDTDSPYTLQSDVITLDVIESRMLHQAAQEPSHNRALVKTSFENCTEDQEQFVKDEFVVAERLVKRSVEFLDIMDANCKSHFEKWFYNITVVTKNYKKIDEEISTGDIAFDIPFVCVEPEESPQEYNSECINNTFLAFTTKRNGVYDGKISLCPKFFEKPYRANAAGHIIHELSHLVLYTEDDAYGEEHSAQLAKEYTKFVVNDGPLPPMRPGDRTLPDVNADNYNFFSSTLHLAPECGGGGGSGGGGALAAATGDPHIMTWDGARYDCQAQGEMIMAKSLNLSFEIQARFEGWSRSSGVSLTTGVALRVPSHPIVQVSIAKRLGAPLTVNNCPVELYLDGSSVNLVGGTTDLGSVILDVSLSQVVVAYKDYGPRISISVNRCYFSVIYELPTALVVDESIVGLLGTPNNNPLDDWMTPDGTSIVMPEDRAALLFLPAYTYCTQNWCMEDEQSSIFTYESSEFGFSFFSKCDAMYDGSIEDALADAPSELKALCGDKMECLIDGIGGGNDIEVARAYLQDEALFLDETIAFIQQGRCNLYSYTGPESGLKADYEAFWNAHPDCPPTLFCGIMTATVKTDVNEICSQWSNCRGPGCFAYEVL